MLQPFKRNFLQHALAVNAWMQQHEAKGGIDPRSLSMEITHNGRAVRFYPQFVFGRLLKAWYWNGVPSVVKATPKPTICGDGISTPRHFVWMGCCKSIKGKDTVWSYTMAKARLRRRNHSEDLEDRSRDIPRDTRISIALTHLK